MSDNKNEKTKKNGFPILPIGSSFYAERKRDLSDMQIESVDKVANQIMNNQRYLPPLQNLDESYTSKGIYPNLIDTQKDYDKARADTQSWLEQARNSAIQLVGNEIVLGMALGLSNLVDAAVNLGKDEGEDDYTNPVSLAIENVQNNIRNRLAIYREDPNAAFALGDFGWWADNFVSVGSTLSLMLPSMGVSKGLSMLGKIGNSGRKASKFLAKASKFKNPVGTDRIRGLASRVRSIEEGTKIGVTALASRTMENYQEAREVYNYTHERALDRLANMTDEEKAEFIRTNPEFKDKDDKTIASIIANRSADVTFRNDYAMLLFDMMQFKGIMGIKKLGLPAKNTLNNARIRIENRNAAKRLLGVTEDKLEDVGFISRQKEAFRYLIANPTKSLYNSVLGLELTEGVEEGFQGIQSEKGKEVLEKTFDKTFTERDIVSYLTDPHIYEQAVWGVIGAKVFQWVGKQYKKGEDYLKYKKYKDKLQNEGEFNWLMSGEEKIKTHEIEQRLALAEEFKNKMQNIANGKDPYNYKRNEDGSIKKTDGINEYEDLLEEDKSIVEAKAIDDYITEMALNAADAGNYDLLKEYLSSPEFDKYLKDAGVEITSQSKSLSNTLIQRMDDIYNTYMSNVMNVMDNIDNIDNEYVVKLQARDITRAKLFIESIDDKLQDLNNRLYEENINNSIINNYLNSERLLKTKEKVNKLLEERNKLQDLFDKNIISLTYKGQREDEIDNIINNLLDNLHESINFDGYIYRTDRYGNVINKHTHNVYDRYNELNNYIENEKELDKQREDEDKIFNIPTNRLPSKTQQELAELISVFEIGQAINQTSIPKNHNEYQKQYDEIAIKVDKLAKKKIDDSVKLVTDWLNEQENLDKAKRQLYQEYEILSNELKDALFTLKLGSFDKMHYQAQIENYIKNLKEKRKIDENKDNGKSANGQVNTQSKTNENIDTQTNIENKKDKKKKEKIQIINDIDETIKEGVILKEEDKKFIDKTRKEVGLVNDNNEIDSFTGGVQNESKEKVDETVPINVINFAFNNLTQEETLAQEQLLQDLLNREVVNLLNEKDETLFNILNKNPEEYESIYKEFLENIYSYLIEQNVNENVVNDTYIEDILNKLAMISRSSLFKKTERTIKLSQNANKLANIIRINKRINASTLNEIETNAIENLEKDIKDYLGLEYNETFQENTKIDIEDLFDYLIYTKKNSINDAVRTFKLIAYINDFLKSNNIIIELPKNHNKFIQKIINDNAYKQALEHNFHMNKAKENNGEPIKEGTKFTISKKGDSIIATDEHGHTIMFISTVEKTKDNNKFKLSSKTASGFLYEVGENDGIVYSNLDEFFNKLIDNIELFEFFKRQFTGVKAKKGDLEFGLTERLLIKILEEKLKNIGLEITTETYKGNFKYKDKLNDEDKLNFLITKINNILFFGARGKRYKLIINLSPEQRKNSVKNWINNIYNNYKKTNEIQELLEKNNNIVQGKVTGIQGNLEIYDDSKDIKDSGLNNSYPIIAVNTQNNLVSESSNVSYTSNHRYTIGTMGMLVQDNPNAPLIAMFTEANKLDKNSELTQQLKIELNNIITKYLKDDEDVNFDVLTRKLIALIGSGPDNLFRGINVIEHEGILYLNVLGNKNKYIAKIYSDNRYIDNINENVKYRIKGNDKNVKKLIDDLVNNIVNNLIFNRTLYFINHKQEHSHDVLGYYGKEKGKIFIKFGDKKIIYENFSDFIIKNNAFKTNSYIIKGKTSVLEYIVGKGNDVFVSLDTNSLPVKEQNKEKAIQAIENPTIVDSSNPKTRITDYILFNFGYEQNDINLLLGKETGIDLLPETFYFDENDKTNNAYYLIKDGKETVALTKRGLENIKDPKYDGKNLFIQYLLHENIHKKFNNLGLKKRKDIIDGLIDTYNEFIEYVNKDNSVEGKALKKWIEDNNFNIDGYFEKNYPNNKFTEEEKRLIFAEEWLCESLSRSRLTNYLNEAILDNTDIIVDNIQEEQKSIWQKIIDLLLKLFGKSTKNIKNNSILAEQYRLLSENIDNSKNDIVEENTIIEEQKDKDTKRKIDKTKFDISKPKRQRKKRSALTEIGEYRQELLDIKNKAIADGTFMKAPNGNPTNLTERQWLQVRTKSFKEWFGDWEKIAPKRISLGKIIPTLDSYGNVEKYGQQGETDLETREVIDEKGNIIGTVRMEFRGLNRNKTVVLHPQLNIKGKGYGQELYQLIANIYNIPVEESFGIISKSKESQKMWNSMMNKGIAIFNNNSEISLRQVIPNNNASKVVDENGEPLVVYHGTNINNITVFNHNAIVGKTFKGTGTNQFGSFFTDDKNSAKSYANIAILKRKYGNSIIYDAFINIKKPLYFNTIHEFRVFTQQNGHYDEDGYFISDVELPINYDGVIVNKTNQSDDSKQIVAPNANQIKSATNNIGTFSTTNNDIRYSTTTEIEDVNLNGTTRVTNMHRYLDNFNERDKALISRNLDNGNISFYCQ